MKTRLQSFFFTVSGSSTSQNFLVPRRCILAAVLWSVQFSAITNGDTGIAQLSRNNGIQTTVSDVDYILSEVRMINNFVTSGMATGSENLELFYDLELPSTTRLYLHAAANTGTFFGRMTLLFRE